MSKKILLVDDEPDLLKIATARLKKAGYEVVTAINGKEALELIKSASPDLILLDLRLPILSGGDVCKKVKSDEATRHIPVIIITASTDSLEEKAREFGAEDFLIKPFEAEILLAKVKRFIG